MHNADKNTIVLQYGKQNKYSWASVIAPLEARGIFEKYNIELVTTRGDLLPLLERVKTSTARYHFVFYTINSYHCHKIFKSIQQTSDFRVEKGLHGKLYILAGGPHANVRPADILAAGADYVFSKESEIALVDFFNEFFANTKKQTKSAPCNTFFTPDNVPNCYYVHPSTRQVIYTHDAELVNLDDYPPIAVDHRMFRPIEITRGCPHGCYFCFTPQMFGYTSRHRSIENIACWIERAVRMKYKRVWFMAPNSFAYGSKGSKPEPDAIERLLKTVRKIKGLEEIYFGTFPSEVRPEFVTNAVLDAVLPNVTNDTFVVGAQSASPAILKSTHRGHTIEDVWRSVDIITGYGCKVDIDMIFGLPGETPDDEAANIEFIKQVLARSGTRIHGHVFMPLPGTAFENEKPGTMSPELLKVIGRYTKEGRVFGQHFVQVKRAIRLSKIKEKQNVRLPG
ncbi:MAG: TIGR04013 family B12-binding domain/radical SAM domain-containing protein [Candidatus Sigynarchaeum springense]